MSAKYVWITCGLIGVGRRANAGAVLGLRGASAKLLLTALDRLAIAPPAAATFRPTLLRRDCTADR